MSCTISFLPSASPPNSHAIFARAAVYAEFGHRHARALDFNGFTDRPTQGLTGPRRLGPRAPLRRGFFLLTVHKANSDIIAPQTTQKRRLILETSHEDQREAAHTKQCRQSPSGEPAHCDSVAAEGPTAWLQGRKRMAGLSAGPDCVSGSLRKPAF